MKTHLLTLFTIIFIVLSSQSYAQEIWCLEDHNLSGTVTNTSQQQGFHAMNTVTSTQDIQPGTNVQYDAGNSVTLLPGFVANSGSTFRAIIKGCNVGISEMGLERFELTNYPNPFSYSTIVSFYLEESSEINLTIKNSLGQTVSSLINGERMQAGEHQITFPRNKLPAGVYFYTLESEDVQITKRMIIQN